MLSVKLHGIQRNVKAYLQANREGSTSQAQLRLGKTLRMLLALLWSKQGVQARLSQIDERQE